VYNRPGTPPPPTTTSASSVGAVARPLRRTRCQSLPSDLDFGAVPDDDEEDDDVSSVLGDDDEAMDDDDEDDGDADDDDGTDDDGAEKEGLWQERRLSKKEMRERKAMAVRAKLTWEEKYEDDPLRSDTPAKVRRLLLLNSLAAARGLCSFDAQCECSTCRTLWWRRTGTSAHTWPWATSPTPLCAR